VDLRTKLVFALVAVSLVSMLALGALAYTSAGEFLTQKTRRQLDSLAETKKQDLETVVLGWRDRVSLIASRTQLRLSLRSYNQTRGPADQERIRRILADALGSSQTVRSLTIYDVEGRPVASAGPGPERGFPDLGASWLPEAGETITFHEILFTAEDEPRASFVASLILEGQRIGSLYVVLSAQDLVDVTKNFVGLGETGETMIVLRDSTGITRVLHPLRHADTERLRSVRAEGPDDPAHRALLGEQGPFVEGLIDYRGEPVWAATRLLPEVGWGVVVKFDAAEERASIEEFRRQLMRFGLSLSAFAILFGTLLGFRFAKPIHDLAEVANRIRLGELNARATIVRQDEFGLLARTFNQMAEELERQVTLLHEFRKYFEFSMDMLCIAGTDGYFKRVNPAFERILGWPEEKLLSQSFIDFVHPDDVDSTVREIEKLTKGIPTVSFENRYRCADGSYKPLLWNSYPEPETGLLYAIARDITELKRAQERLRAAGESEPTDRS
jgi:PAS domain S-box-containing protein